MASFRRAVFLARKVETGAELQKPANSALFSPLRGAISGFSTAWLTRQDSKSHLPNLQTPIEISKRISNDFLNSGFGDFRNYRSFIRECGRPIGAWFCPASHLAPQSRHPASDPPSMSGMPFNSPVPASGGCETALRSSRNARHSGASQAIPVLANSWRTWPERQPTIRRTGLFFRK